MFGNFKTISICLSYLGLSAFFSACNSGANSTKSSVPQIATASKVKAQSNNVDCYQGERGGKVAVITSPDGMHLYSGGDMCIIWYNINSSDGSLAYLGGIQTSDQQTGITISPDGKYVYSISYLEPTRDSESVNFINWYNVNPYNATLTYAGKIQIEKPQIGIAVSPDGTHIYSASGENINWYNVNTSDGFLTYAGSTKVSGQQLGIKISLDGKHAYSTEYPNPPEYIGYVNWFNVSSLDGSLTYAGRVKLGGELSSGETALEEIAFGVAVSPDNTHVYISGEHVYSYYNQFRKFEMVQEYYILGYNILSEDGSLIENPEKLYASIDVMNQQLPLGLIISPDGKYLYAAMMADYIDCIPLM